MDTPTSPHQNGPHQTTTHQVVFTPSGKRGSFAPGVTVLEAARQLGVDLDTLCGGRGICGRCQITPSYGDFAKHQIRSIPEHIGDPNKVEDRYREKRGLKSGRRLGCQCKIGGDLVIDVPPESQVHRQVIRKGAEARTIRNDPVITLKYVKVEEPDMHHPSGDLERLQAALRREWRMGIVKCPLPILGQLQKALRDGDWNVTVALHNRNEIVAIWPGFQSRVYGIAVDVGSTTMSAHITDLRTGRIVTSTGAMNPQIRYGEDLMSRVSYAMMNPEGASLLTEAVRETLRDLLIDACEEVGIDRQLLLELVLVGNPIMHHLMLGLNPVELGWAPFALGTNQPVSVWAQEIGLAEAVNPGARAYFLPCVAGHVGADAAAVVLSEGPQWRDDISLIVDIGTNAEIILGNSERLLACSSPTGPALEGAQISCGQRAANGAIERIRIDPETFEPRYKVIGCDLWSDETGFEEAIAETGVSGVCGSGIIELIGEMFLTGLITVDGVIDGNKQASTDRIFAHDRTFGYRIRESGEKGGPDISLIQADVRAIQLAKAALYAGSQLLIDKLGKKPDRIVLAGAFGSHIDTQYAMVLGLIPDCDLDRVSSIGNAAGTGARIALLNKRARAEITRVVRMIEKIETAVEPAFQEHFVSAMAFPHKTADFPNLAQKVNLPPRQVAEPGGERSTRRRRRDRQSASA